MDRKLLIAFGAAALFAAAANTGAVTQAMAFGAEFAGPGPGITGNNTGGIFPYRPGRPAVFSWSRKAFAPATAAWQGDQHPSHLRRLRQLRLLRPAGPNPLTLAPVAEHRLHHSQHRDRRGVGPQDARTERKPHHVRLSEQRRALVLGKTAFGPDQHRERLGAAALASATAGSAARRLRRKTPASAPDRGRRDSATAPPAGRSPATPECRIAPPPRWRSPACARD